MLFLYFIAETSMKVDQLIPFGRLRHWKKRRTCFRHLRVCHFKQEIKIGSYEMNVPGLFAC